MTHLDPQSARILLAVLVAFPAFATLCANGIASAKRKVRRHG